MKEADVSAHEAPRRGRRRHSLASVGLAIPILLLDLWQDPDVALAVLYAAPVLLALRAPGRRLVLGVAALCSVLTVIGALVPPVDQVHWSVVVENRAIGMLAIWGSALAGLRLRALALAMQRSASALHESEQRFRLIFETVRDPVFVHEVAPNGRPLKFLEVNQAACRAYGYTRQEFMDMELSQLASTADRSLDQLLMRMTREESVLFEAEHRTRSGRRVPVEVRVQRIEFGGREAILSVARDVTERKKAERDLRDSGIREKARADELQVLMDSVPALVFIAHDPGCLRITGSRTTHEMLRLPPDVNLSLRQPAGAAPGHFRVFDRRGRELGIHELPLSRAVRGEDLHGCEIVIRFDDGTELWLYGNAMPLRDESGQIRGALTAMVDVSAHRQTQKRLEQLTADLEQRIAARTADLAASQRELAERARQLQQLNTELTQTEQRERRKLGRILHDDIQQMLVAVKMQMGMIKRGNSGSIPASIDRVTRHLDETIRSTRLLSHELSPQILYDSGLPEALHWLAARQRENFGLILHVDADADETRVPVSETTRVLLFQAVREVLLNTVKHGRVREASVLMSRRDGELCLSVSDEGVGFDPAWVLGDAGGASHLGLFAIHERLAVIGGRMVIDSAPGQGTTVELYAPLDDARTGVAAEVPAGHAATLAPDDAATKVVAPEDG